MAKILNGRKRAFTAILLGILK